MLQYTEILITVVSLLKKPFVYCFMMTFCVMLIIEIIFDGLGLSPRLNSWSPHPLVFVLSRWSLLQHY